MGRPYSVVKSSRIYLNVHYNDREEAKALGAKFRAYQDKERPLKAPAGYWYIPPGVPVGLFRKWPSIPDPFPPIDAARSEGKSAAAVELGSLGGLAGGHKGGVARAASLSPERRSEIARMGAEALKANRERQRRARMTETSDNRDIEDDDDECDIIPARNHDRREL